MDNFFDDRNRLAMLAVPVILAMLLGFSGESLMTEDYTHTNTRNVKQIEESRDAQSRKEQLRASVESKDYGQFLKAAENTPFADIMTKEVFNEIVEEYSIQKHGYRPSPYFKHET